MSSTRLNKFIGERDFVRSVHLGFDDVDRMAAAVVDGSGTRVQIVHRDEGRDGGVDDRFGNRAALRVEKDVGHDMVADVAHQERLRPCSFFGAPSRSI